MSLTSQPIERTGKDIYTVICDNCKCSEVIGKNIFGIITERMLYGDTKEVSKIGWVTIKNNSDVKDYCPKCKESELCQTVQTQNL